MELQNEVLDQNVDQGQEIPAEDLIEKLPESPEDEQKDLTKEEPQEANGQNPEEKSIDNMQFEPEQVDKFVKWMGVPKGVDYFIDKYDKTLKFVVPIDGKKYIQTPEEVISGFGLNQAGHLKLEEAKNIIKSNRELYDFVKDDPKRFWDLADKFGVDKRQLAYDYLSQVVQEEEMTEEEKYKKKIEALEAEKAEHEKQKKLEAQKREHDALVSKEIENLNREFQETLPSLGFKKYSPKTKMAIVGSAIEKVKFYNAMGKNLSIKDAVTLAKQEKMSLIQDYFGELDDKRLMDTIPKSIVERLRSVDLENLSRGQTSIPTSSSPIGGKVDLRQLDNSRSPKKIKKQSVGDYFDSLGKD